MGRKTKKTTETFHFATCKYCEREMDRGCVKHWYLIDGKEYEAIKNGDDGNKGTCHDCNARQGEYHHPGCDMEICPVCGEQIIGFHDCDVTEVILANE